MRWLPAAASLLAIWTSACASQHAATPIGSGTQVEQTLQPPQTQAYALQLDRGESAAIVVHQQGVDVIVDLRSPSGALLDSIDRTGKFGDEVAEILASQSGRYGIVVRPYDPSGPAGRYRLVVTAVRSARETRRLIASRAAMRREAARWLAPHNTGLASRAIVDQLANRARIVGLGEATHGSREFGDVRLELTQYLIAHRGFRAVAVEASETGAQTGWIDRRSRGRLAAWVRRWNVAHPHDRVRVVGVDAQGNAAARKTLTAFLNLAYGATFVKRWTPAERELTAADEQTIVFGDSEVSTPTVQAVFDVLAMLNLDAPILATRFSRARFEAALEGAKTLAEFADFNSAARTIGHSRDWYMAARVLRAANFGNTRVVYWAHNAHVQHPPNSDATTGSVLRASIGCRYAAVAITFDRGDFVAQIPDDLRDRLTVSTLPLAEDDSVESVLRTLRSGPSVTAWPCPSSPTALGSTSPVPRWLTIAHPMHWIGGLYRPGSAPSYAYRLFDMLEDFDGIVFLPRVTAEAIPTARPLIPARVLPY